MTSTHFTTGTTITSEWLNDVNDAVYEGNITAEGVQYTPPFTGGITETVEAKLAQTVSVKDFGAVGDGVTDDTAAIQDAVNYCYGIFVELVWPEGTYLTTSSITNLHNVQNRGFGAIERDGNLFYVEPKTQSNTIYVSATGNDANDGLSINDQIASVQKAFDILEQYANQILDGVWTIQLSAGTYFGSAIFPENIGSINRVVIKGPDVSRSTPTAIIDGTGSSYIHGLYFSNNAFIELRDILVRNFTGTGGYGILFNRQQWDVNLYNVWSTNNYSGAAFVGTGIVQWQLGKISDNASIGIVCQDRCRYTLGYGATTVYSGSGPFLTTDGLYIYNNALRGVDCSRISYGYIQRCLIESNTAGAYIHLLTRARLFEPLFKNNTVGFVCRDNSAVNNSATFSGNTVDQQFFDGAVSVNFSLANVQNLGSVVHLGALVEDKGQPAGSGTWVQQVPSFASLPGNSLRTFRGKLRVSAFGAMSNTASYSFRVYVGGLYMAQIDIADAISGNFKLEMEISGVTSANTQTGYMNIITPTKTYSTAISNTRDLTADSSIQIYTFRNNTSDSTTFNYATAELFGEML